MPYAGTVLVPEPESLSHGACVPISFPRRGRWVMAVRTQPAQLGRMASAPLARSVITLSRSAMNRKRLWQRFGRISVSDESHCGHRTGKVAQRYVPHPPHEPRSHLQHVILCLPLAFGSLTL